MSAAKCNGLDAANDQPAKVLINIASNSIAKPCALGKFPPRHYTVTAEVLCRLLNGESITGMDAVFVCSTTRLSAVIHYLANKHGWYTDHEDTVVGTNDGRVVTIRAYFLSRAVIRCALDAGALEFCSSVKLARAKSRKLAPKARAEAAKRNAARFASKVDPRQRSLFGDAHA
ncbi:MAG: hypothetical protein ACD_23C00252G0002 [uncultured bacterium]|nr:MAG: hypothetical protein ACD_23C00252G0002 [uncultured bacterium]